MEQSKILNLMSDILMTVYDVPYIYYLSRYLPIRFLQRIGYGRMICKSEEYNLNTRWKLYNKLTFFFEKEHHKLKNMLSIDLLSHYLCLDVINVVLEYIPPHDDLVYEDFLDFHDERILSLESHYNDKLNDMDCDDEIELKQEADEFMASYNCCNETETTDNDYSSYTFSSQQ